MKHTGMGGMGMTLRDFSQQGITASSAIKPCSRTHSSFLFVADATINMALPMTILFCTIYHSN